MKNQQLTIIVLITLTVITIEGRKLPSSSSSSSKLIEPEEGRNSNVDSRQISPTGTSTNPNKDNIREIDPDTLSMAEDLMLFNKAFWPMAVKATKFIMKNVMEKIQEEADRAMYEY